MFQCYAQRILTWECSEDGITLLSGGGDQPSTYSMSSRRPSNCTVSVKKDCNEIAQVSDRQSGCNVGLLSFFLENNTCSLRQELFMYLCIIRVPHQPSFEFHTQLDATVSQQLLHIFTTWSMQLRAIHTTHSTHAKNKETSQAKCRQRCPFSITKKWDSGCPKRKKGHHFSTSTSPQIDGLHFHLFCVFTTFVWVISKYWNFG